MSQKIEENSVHVTIYARTELVEGGGFCVCVCVCVGDRFGKE